MINLVGTSAATAMAVVGVRAYRQHCGLLTSPKSRQDPAYAAGVGAPWAMDNDAFTGFVAEPFVRMMMRWRYVPNCLFVVAPDAIQNARLTLEYFSIWRDVIKAFGLPVAFVLQNGMHEHRVPYEWCDAIFIGGDNLFKYSSYVDSVAAEAQRRGLWVHNGRVNGRKRIAYSRAIGCSSFDGTGYAIEPGRIGRELSWWASPEITNIQPALVGLEGLS